MNRKLLLLIIFLVIIVIGGFIILSKGEEASSIAKPDISTIKTVIDANNQFALDYYQKLKSRNEDNIFFSPFSISNALVMVYEGANGKTAEEIRSTFYFPIENNQRQEQYADLLKKTNKEGSGIHSANALWIQKGYEISSDYLKSVENYYGGRANNLDFRDDAEGSLKEINSWVSEQTNGMIKSVLSELKPEVKLILTNAIHFKGEWVEKFDKASTEESDFTLDNKTKTKVQMMQQTARFNYMENNDLQVLEMPYVGEEVSIMLLLPKEKSLQKLDSILSIKNISEWSSQLTEQEVHILIPKFKIETNYPMTDDLKSMGMPLAFSNQADFSKMTVNSKKLKIDQVIHKAVIDLDEKGTEAAATTTALMMWGSAALGIEKPIPIFRADHPFIFSIKHKENGSILFMGNFSNPNKI